MNSRGLFPSACRVSVGHGAFAVAEVCFGKRLFVAALAGAVFGMAAVAQGAPLEGPWTALSPLTVSNDTTNAPVAGTGADNSAQGAMYATFEPVTLQVGESITVNADLEIIGASSSNPDGALRLGLFNRNGSTDTTGWKGYMAVTRNSSGSDSIFERSGTGTGVFYTITSSGSYRSDSDNTSSGTVGAKSFHVEQTVTRTSTGVTVTASFTQTSTGSPQYFFTLTTATNDTTPSTLTYDAVGFFNVSGFSPDQINYSNIEVLRPNRGTLIQLGNPLAVLLVPLVGSSFLVRRFRARR